MDSDTKRLVHLAIAWCGPLFVLGYIIFWAVLGHNVPPPNMMGMTAEQLISEYYGKYQSDIAIGMVGCAVIGILYLPWSLLLASTLRDENGALGIFSLMEAAGGTLTAWVLAFAPAIWAACAVLATSVSPEVIRSMHVFTWIIYDCTFMITSVQLFGTRGLRGAQQEADVLPRMDRVVRHRRGDHLPAFGAHSLRLRRALRR